MFSLHHRRPPLTAPLLKLLPQLSQLIPQLRCFFVLPMLHCALHLLFQRLPMPPFSARDPLFQPQAHHCRSLIHQIHGLIRPAPLGKVPSRQLHCRSNCIVCVVYPVELLKIPLKPLQDFHGFPFRGLRHLYLRKSPAECGIPLDILPILLLRGCADHLDLPPSQRRL